MARDADGTLAEYVPIDGPIAASFRVELMPNIIGKKYQLML